MRKRQDSDRGVEVLTLFDSFLELLQPFETGLAIVDLIAPLFEKMLQGEDLGAIDVRTRVPAGVELDSLYEHPVGG